MKGGSLAIPSNLIKVSYYEHLEVAKAGCFFLGPGEAMVEEEEELVGHGGFKLRNYGLCQSMPAAVRIAAISLFTWGNSWVMIFQILSSSTPSYC